MLNSKNTTPNWQKPIVTIRTRYRGVLILETTRQPAGKFMIFLGGEAYGFKMLKQVTAFINRYYETKKN